MPPFIPLPKRKRTDNDIVREALLHLFDKFEKFLVKVFKKIV